MEKSYKAGAVTRSGDDAMVDELLIQSTATAQHGQSWLDAAHRGHALNLLRRERARHRKVTLPVWEFLAGLASQARISLDKALAAFELDTQPVVSRHSTRKVAEVLEHIGCTAEETYRMIRLSFAEVHASGSMTDLPIAPRGGKETLSISRCEESLKQVEARYPAELRDELGEMKTAVMAQFRKGA